MIGYIKGKLLSVQDNVVILENNGIGYEIACSRQALNNIIADNGGDVFTYMAVREDGVFLYGFNSVEEKNMFLKLISVSGVGPKMGITILSNMEIGELAIKIATSDIKGLSSVKGLGKKTAERIIVELREKVDAETSLEKVEKTEQIQLTKEDDDAVYALLSLGFTKGECVEAVKKAKEQGASSIEQIISFALKNIR
ncbi:MAG: Holliday junction branch migration protein RuvA [Clostridia bacterium]|nr:Holliday junction branch migration protein RuvA [Clostridia bacterium]